MSHTCPDYQLVIETLYPTSEKPSIVKPRVRHRVKCTVCPEAGPWADFVVEAVRLWDDPYGVGDKPDVQLSGEVARAVEEARAEADRAFETTRRYEKENGELRAMLVRAREQVDEYRGETKLRTLTFLLEEIDELLEATKDVHA